jgi:hypothetical protein
MFVINNTDQLFQIYKEKCLKHQTFKRMDRRNKTTLIKDGRIQYVYYAVKKRTYNTRISKSRISVLFRSVKEAYHKYIIENNFTIDVPEKKGMVRGKNIKLWQSLNIGDTYYCLDLSHAYWRQAKMIGMLHDKLYNKYKDDKDMKLFRNMAFAAVLAPKTVEYVVNGRYAGCFTEDTSIYNEVYKKIRFTVYNLIYDLKDILIDSWLEYNIDAIYFLPDSLKIAKKYMDDLGYIYTIEKCQKINNDEYVVLKGGEIKSFYRKPLVLK